MNWRRHSGFVAMGSRPLSLTRFHSRAGARARLRANGRGCATVVFLFGPEDGALATDSRHVTSPTRFVTRIATLDDALVTLGRMRLRRGSSRLLVGPMLLACSLGSSNPSRPLAAGGRHVLFIGNSLTYVNDLPATVAAIADASGDTVRYTVVAGPDLALIDHANGRSGAVGVIRREHWDYVVLQQGPTPAGVCRDTLILATRILDAYIRAAGGRTALFMTWPTSAGSSAFFDEVRASFQEAAQAVNGMFLPAGEAWRAAWARDSTLALYGLDGFHPSATGTFLAALEIYERLSGRDARLLPIRAFSNGKALELTEATIRLLQDAAHAANTQFAADDTRAPTGAVVARTQTAISVIC